MTTNRTTKSGLAIADHLMVDGETFEDECRYHASRWTRPVYSVGGEYWASGTKPPSHRDGDALSWRKVISSHDNRTVLWCGTESEE